jgi:hypothetical protein
MPMKSGTKSSNLLKFPRTNKKFIKFVEIFANKQKIDQIFVVAAFFGRFGVLCWRSEPNYFCKCLEFEKLLKNEEILCIYKSLHIFLHLENLRFLFLRNKLFVFLHLKFSMKNNIGLLI